MFDGVWRVNVKNIMFIYSVTGHLYYITDKKGKTNYTLTAKDMKKKHSDSDRIELYMCLGD